MADINPISRLTGEAAKEATSTGTARASSMAINSPLLTRPQPPEQRLASLFRRQIRPQLGDLERTQQHVRDVGLVLVASGLVLIYAWFRWFPWPQALLGTTAVAVLGASWLHHLATTYEETLREVVMPTLCEAVGDVFHRQGLAPELDFLGMDQLGLLPGADRRVIGNVFRGHHCGTGFMLAELEIPPGGDHPLERQGFRGLLAMVELPAPFSGRLKVIQAGGGADLVLTWLDQIHGMYRVALPDQAFDQAFEVYADQPDAALDRLPAPLCEGLMALADLSGPGLIRAGFVGRQFCLAMPMASRPFRLGGPLRPLDCLEADLGRLVEEVTLAHCLVEIVQAGGAFNDQPQPLASAS